MADFSQLTPEEKNEFWRQTEAQIRSLLGSLSPRLSEPAASVVLDYLEHNELGVALEHLSDTIVEARSNVSQQELEQLEALFARMHLDPGNRLVALRELVAP